MRHGITLALILTTVAGAIAAPTSAQDEGYIISPGGVKLHYRITGVGRDTIVVIADGPAGHMNAVAPDYAELARYHRVLFYDQRGGGKSTAPMRASEVALPDQVRDLEALRGYMGFKKMRIVAHGFGSLIALRYTQQYGDRVERIAMVAPAPVRKAHVAEAGVNAIARLAPADTARFNAAVADYAGATAANVVAACRALWLLEKPVLVGAAANAAKVKGDPCNASPEGLLFAQGVAMPAVAQELGEWDFRTTMRGITQPVLVIQGEQDVIPVASATEWAAAFPQARLLLLPGVGHFPEGEAGTAYVTALNAFLAGGWPAAAKAVPTVVAQLRE